VGINECVVREAKGHGCLFDTEGRESMKNFKGSVIIIYTVCVSFKNWKRGWMKSTGFVPQLEPYITQPVFYVHDTSYVLLPNSFYSRSTQGLLLSSLLFLHLVS
jgi:hypothetical protein